MGSCSQDKKARSAQSPLLRHSTLLASGGEVSLASSLALQPVEYKLLGVALDLSAPPAVLIVLLYH